MDSDIRAVLNRIIWDERCNLSRLRVSYVDRGQPGDTSVATGDDIVDVMQHFFKTADGMIPFHRIITIWYDGEVVFSR
ncbi:MAG: DUF504 domain-containing protein [Candidatus Thermoplasmatota archaeon]|nr:DUF504 domain-containing protein [Candidatus Thermoplasmatota archaeon]